MSMNQPGAWAKKVVPGWALTIYDAAEALHMSPRWVRELLRRYGLPRDYVRRHVRLADGRVRVRYALALRQSVVQELALRHLGEATERAIRTFTPRPGTSGRWRPHRRKGTW